MYLDKIWSLDIGWQGVRTIDTWITRLLHVASRKKRLRPKTLQDHATSKRLISEVTIFVTKSQDVDEIAAAWPHLRSGLGALVGRYWVYVENHHGENRDCFIWTRFDLWHMTSWFLMVCFTLLREDPLISETFPLEESASHQNQLRSTNSPKPRENAS